MTVSVGSLDASVGGKIRADDVVTVLIVSGKGEQERASIRNSLKYMQIISVLSRDGVEITGESSEAVPAFANLKCTLQQARELAQLNATYKLHLAFAAHSSSEKATELLETQRQYFENSAQTSEGQQ